MKKSEINLSGKSLVITGAAGFVGSHLSEFYLERGARVIGVDNFCTGSEQNLVGLMKHGNFSFIKADVTRLPEEAPELWQQPIDYIFNLASPASPIDFDRIPVEIMMTNSLGVYHLLNLARATKARFLEASTSEVYGDPEVHPQREDYVGHVQINGPRSCYDESKRFAEALTSSFRNHYGVETRTVRIFNTYGPRMRPEDGRVIPNFINQALKGESITVYGDGSQTRSFCYVGDLCRAIHTVMFLEDSSPYNIGNPDEKSVLETAQMIVQLTGSRSPIVFKELPVDDPRRRRPDLSKLEQASDYRPLVSFEEGMSKTIEYFSKLL